MTITRIEKKNEAFFAPLFLEAAGQNGRDILRIGAVEDGKACAAASFELNGMTAAITSLFVAPAFRRRGLGRAMIETFGILAAGTQVTSLTTSFIPESKDGLTDFFEAEGFELFGGSPSFVVSYEDAKNADSLKKYLLKADQKGVVLSYAELSDLQKHELDRNVRPYGAALSEITVGSFSPELSFAFFKNGAIAAALFCSEPERQINIDFLFSHLSTAGPTLAMIQRLADCLEKREKKPEKLVFLASNPVVPAIAEELFGPRAHADGAAVYGVKLLSPAGKEQ